MPSADLPDADMLDRLPDDSHGDTGRSPGRAALMGRPDRESRPCCSAQRAWTGRPPGRCFLGTTELTGLDERDLDCARRGRIRFVFQSSNPLPMLNVHENLALPLRLTGRRPRRSEVIGVLRQVGLDGPGAPAPGCAVRWAAAAGGDRPVGQPARHDAHNHTAGQASASVGPRPGHPTRGHPRAHAVPFGHEHCVAALVDRLTGGPCIDAPICPPAASLRRPSSSSPRHCPAGGLEPVRGPHVRQLVTRGPLRAPHPG
jgi:hypothetical protein